MRRLGQTQERSQPVAGIRLCLNCCVHVVIALVLEWSVCHGWQGNGEVQSLKGGLCKDDFNLRLIHDANHAC
jgi:uncharacterized protein YwlG (UPF0340 family)